MCAARAHEAATGARPALASSRNERATGVDQAAPSIDNVAQPAAQPASPIVDQRPSTSRHSCGQRTSAARPARIRAASAPQLHDQRASRARGRLQLSAASCATVARRAVPLPAAMRGQRAWLSRAHVRAAGRKGRRRMRRWRGRKFKEFR
ncbi:hypothetical protein F511_42031 [Dorcoceras hygrometricum]|uniref:Uncharacterized protein n=1 Tax=Dorcoceras hygrometricum TaxID=472368 RepID=A0A2Z7B0U7_9LAMI|nr:hypothetical protein F511_42031 [Dorcoceras hygrometricum]